ncbi:MAG: toll/interleukin-1 receptor domain-containing protein [Desulfobaccales bacterium]
MASAVQPAADEEKPPEYKYWAFISYSHQDEPWAAWLHKGLETYGVPPRLVGREERDFPVPKKIFPVFRDREELPTSADLSQQINLALRQSRYLIVICSPQAATSIWVNEEIKYFKALGRENQILAVIVDGEPNASDKPDSSLPECFPPALRYRLALGNTS